VATDQDVREVVENIVDKYFEKTETVIEL